jgi:O-antigen ligase
LVVVLFFLIILWKKLRQKYLLFFVAWVALFFLFFLYFIPWYDSARGFANSGPRLVGDPVRLAMWLSILEHLPDIPWFGYGWGEIEEGIRLIPNYPAIQVNTKNTHNIILDVFMSSGPLVGGIFLLLVTFLFLVMLKRAVLKGLCYWIPFLSVFVLCLHSLFEFPLFFAFFLFPFGLLLGCLISHFEIKVLEISKRPIGVFVLFLFVAVFLTVRDYHEVERTYYTVYYGIRGEDVPPEDRPKILLLTQWVDRFDFANHPPYSGFDEFDYRRAKGVLSATPSPFLMLLLSMNLLQTGNKYEGLFWLEEVCRVTNSDSSEYLRQFWLENYKNNSVYASIAWPDCPTVIDTRNRAKGFLM